MPGVVQLPPAVRALLDAGLALSRQAPSARVALARAEALVDRDALPRALAGGGLPRELERARAAACVPLAVKEVEKLLKRAWGRPAGKVLDDLEREPLAVRAASQVHRGELDGAAVAIKVRRPGLERALRADLALADSLAAPLRAAFPRLDPGPLLRAAREQALDELDLEHEASQQRSVARALRTVDGLVIPRAHAGLTAGGVLVCDLLDGPTLADGAVPADPEAVARTLVAAHVAALRDAGLALLDPRPSHVVLMPDGRTGLLGTGLARPVDRARAEHALAALAALREDDDAAFAGAAIATGLLEEEAARSAAAILREVAAELLTGPARLDAPSLRAAGDRGLRATPRLLDAIQGAAPIPDDLWLGRTAAQLVATLARLRATHDWARLPLA